MNDATPIPAAEPQQDHTRNGLGFKKRVAILKLLEQQTEPAGPDQCRYLGDMDDAKMAEFCAAALGFRVTEANVESIRVECLGKIAEPVKPDPLADLRAEVATINAALGNALTRISLLEAGRATPDLFKAG